MGAYTIYVEKDFILEILDGYMSNRLYLDDLRDFIDVLNSIRMDMEFRVNGIDDRTGPPQATGL